MFDLIPLGGVNVNVVVNLTVGVVNIAVGETKIVDNPNMDTAVGAIWDLTIINQVGLDVTLVETSTVRCVIRGDLTVNHNQYGIVGDDIDYDLDVILVDGYLKLLITNNGVSPLVINFNRTLI